MTGGELRQLREERGIRASWIAERIGLKHRQQINKIENKKDVSVDEFVAYVGALGLKPGDLLENSASLLTADTRPVLEVLNKMQPSVRRRTLEIVQQVAGIQEELAPKRSAEDNVLDFVPARAPSVPTTTKQVNSLDEAMRQLNLAPRIARKAQTEFSVPLLANVSAGKGLVSFVREHEYRDILKYYWDRGVRAAFKVVGGSMWDMGIADGYLLYVKPIEFEKPERGDVVVFTLNDESFVKVYEPNEDGTITFRSKAEGYTSITADPKKDDIRIWGVVVGAGGDL